MYNSPIYPCHARSITIATDLRRGINIHVCVYVALCTTYITVCQDVYNLYTGLGDCVVRSLHACKYPGNVTEWRHLGVYKSGQSYTRMDKVMQEWKRVDSYANCS